MSLVAPGAEQAELSQDDILLTATLLDAINRQFLPKVFETFLFGVLVLLVAICVYVLIRNLNSTKQKIMLCTILVMFSASSVMWAIDIQLLLYDYQLTSVILSTGDVNAQMPANTSAIEVVDLLCNTINIILGDMVVLWRACVVYGYRRIFVIPSALLATMVIVNWTLATVNGIRSIVFSAAMFGNAEAISVLSYTSSLLLNLWVTSAIAIMAWRHRRRIRDYVRSARRKTALERILALLVESGFVYCALWIVYMGTTLGDLESGGGIGDCMAMLIPLYPVLVILLVALQKSPGDHHLTNAPDACDPTTVEGQRKMLANIARTTSQGSSVVVIGNDFDSFDLATVEVKL